jgi:hypothetical protein
MYSYSYSSSSNFNLAVSRAVELRFEPNQVKVNAPVLALKLTCTGTEDRGRTTGST